MSIVESLIRLADPVQAREREEDRRKDREQPLRADSGAPPEFACRICGHCSTDRSYCPTCLADTMEPLARDR